MKPRTDTFPTVAGAVQALESWFNARGDADERQWIGIINAHIEGRFVATLCEREMCREMVGEFPELMDAIAIADPPGDLRVFMFTATESGTRGLAELAGAARAGVI